MRIERGSWDVFDGVHIFIRNFAYAEIPRMTPMERTLRTICLNRFRKLCLSKASTWGSVSQYRLPDLNLDAQTREDEGGEYVVIWASSLESTWRMYPSEGQDLGLCVLRNSSMDPLGPVCDESASLCRIIQSPNRFSMGTGGTA